MEPVRVASVGLGVWGGNLADKARQAGLEIAGCFARTQEHREEFARVHGGRPAASLDEVLSDPDVEAVMIATPHSTHANLVVAAAGAGKHVFVDKPFTLTVAEGKRAIRAAEAAGVVLQVGHNRRRQPATRRLKKMIAEGKLGMIHYAEANLSYPKGLNPRSGWRGDPAESPAGGMTGLGVHMADNLNYLLGRPARVAAFSRRVIGVGRLDDVTTATLEFQDGALAFLGTAMVIPDIARTAVWGTEAAAWNEMDGERFYVQRAGDKERSAQPIETLDTVINELEEFAENVRNGTKPETGGPEALEAVAVLEGIVESASTGTVVDLDEVRGRE
ncbi:MAG: Gfo/Idh/MocA family oxidoreductase [Acidimicrobiia bacterium]|nr:Gfo/Idh/MocA family oxidoreductase [Acidimicrobiia bacterium]MDH3425873.1 Gfo/Idh/MocA family oxidoreductase [Acidimicrobiia bacterium]MDH5616442.1 Gfo/Idh/MocA family oxidoreductase [Acidimicrobiia bacterium]